jgi:hypothetical protein
MNEPACMNRHACWLLLLLLAGASCYCWHMLVAAAAHQPTDFSHLM